MEIIHAIHHPSRALLLAQFPVEGLDLDSHNVREAIRFQLDATNTPSTIERRPSRPDLKDIMGISRVYRPEVSPYLLITSYLPSGSTPIPQREVYRAMSFPPELASTSKPSADKADGLVVFGTNPRYTVFVQAEDPKNQHGIKGLRSYTDNIMPSTEHDNFRVAAMRAMMRLGLA